MKEIKSSRRRFLLSFFGLGLLALARPCFAWGGVQQSMKHDPLSSRLEALLRCKESAMTIGREYLQVVCHERNPQLLLDLISSVGGEPVFDLDPERLRACLRLRVRLDFEEGDIVKMHGWMLSHTEARLCALAALVLPQESSSILSGK
jgi:hypothetical protein